MKKRELCLFGKKINYRLIALDQSKGWLIEQVKRHTGLYFDRSYLRKIEIGQLATPKIVDAICEILGLPVQDDYTKRKDR
ncbi:MAG: XRE family transcriptional regulator [Agathobaculum desmolans]|uniref:XRE family transcriptional regulator n=1 Tax=Agathobaculum desmolans TaxID=39484 RepID=UPI003990E792